MQGDIFQLPEEVSLAVWAQATASERPSPPDDDQTRFAPRIEAMPPFARLLGAPANLVYAILATSTRYIWQHP